MTTEEWKVAPGHVETLTEEQERKLKLVWTYLLTFFGYKLALPEPRAISRRSTTNSVLSAKMESSTKSKGLFGRFRKSHKKTESIEKLERVISHPSTDASSKEDAGGRIHYAFKGLNSDDMNKAFWGFLRQDTPDNLVLRFVRARKWDVDKSLVMMTDTMKWRCYEGKPDKILCSGELGCVENDKPGVIYQFQLGKCIIRGHDRKGRPIAMVRARKHHSSDQTPEEIEIYTLLIIEYARLMLNEPIDTCDILFNLSKMTMANMDWGAVSYIVRCFESHYPESLGILFVHKAPWIFSGIWRIVKTWLDPVVASKIVFTNSDKDLEKYIERDNIPKEVGGDDDYEWHYLDPTPSENGLLYNDQEKKKALEDERKELTDSFINKTIEWIEAPDDQVTATLLKERIQIGRALAKNYRKLDGYIRNRSFYDRTGALNVESPTS